MNLENKILLTVIIPHYNSPSSLERLLSSIPRVDSCQVIVIDDHSSIDLTDVRRAFNWVEFLTQDVGKKWAGAARNKGLSHAWGKYVLFADADDYFVPEAFSTINPYLSGEHDVVYFSPTSTYDDGTPSTRHYKYNDLVIKYLENSDDTIRYEYFVPWSKLFKLSFIKERNILFDEVVASNDVMFSLLTGFYGDNFKVSNETIYCVVESHNSLTKVISEQVVDSRFKVLCRYNDFVKRELCEGRQIAAVSCISRARKISLFKMLSVLFFSLHKGYPIAPNKSGFKRWVKRLF